MREFDLQQVGGKFESKRVSTGEASYRRVKFFCSFSMTSFCFSSLFQNSFVCNQLKVEKTHDSDWITAVLTKFDRNHL